MNAVGVRALPISNNFDIAECKVVACISVGVEQLAVQRCYPLHYTVVHPIEFQRLQYYTKQYMHAIRDRLIHQIHN